MTAKPEILYFAVHSLALNFLIRTPRLTCVVAFYLFADTHSYLRICFHTWFADLLDRSRRAFSHVVMRFASTIFLV